jgi:membrane-bound inhibitor of C-type lysozyme
MLMSFRWYVAATIGLAAIGPAHAIEAHYECAGGTRVVAQFSPPNAVKGQVVLTFEVSGSRTILPQARSADGGRYAGDRIEFWIKGRTARLTRGSVSETCITD